MDKANGYQMQIDDFEYEFIVAMSEDGDFTVYQAYMIMRMAELNSGDIDLDFIQKFYNEDINSQDLISIEMMYHYNVEFEASLDWIEYGVWAERTAEGYRGLAISIAQGSPLEGYYGNDVVKLSADEVSSSLKQSTVKGKITGYTAHGLNQAIARNGGKGVNSAAINDAVNNPISTEVQQRGNGYVTKYVGSSATVVLNDSGKVVTTWATNSMGTMDIFR